MTILSVLALTAQLTAVQQAPMELTDAVKTQTIDALVKNLNERYVYPEVAKKFETSLKSWMANTDYKAINDPEKFAEQINELLKKEAKDAHLRFRYSPKPLPQRDRPAEPSAAEIKQYEQHVKFSNAAFERVERLPGNVGYISFRGFEEPADMARPLSAAMKFLENSDAMIVDLRQNGGGDPAGVQLFCSYFFTAKPVHLNNIWYRKGDKVEKTESWTLKTIDGPRFPEIPLYVLTGKRTGSGAEECAYNFQQLHRATLIGESTWGGANPGGVVRLGDHFGCFIPSGRAENPYTKTNWEGTGVLPDVKVESPTALKEAHILALKKLLAGAKDPDRKVFLTEVIGEVTNGK